MKKIILSIVLLLFTFLNCSCANNNQYTTSGMINNVQTQMNGIMKSIRNMDNIYLEDYAINQINPISFNTPIKHTGYYPNYNIQPYNMYNPIPNINNYNPYTYNNYIPYYYNYNSTHPYYYGYPTYNNYHTGTNYNIDTFKNFNSNVDTYMANNGIYGNSTIPGQSNNIIVSNINDGDAKTVSNNNLNNFTNYQPYNTYQPKYITQNGQEPNRTFLHNYISSIEDLFLITSDLNIANQKLSSISNSIIELTVNIKNNVFYLNYNKNNLSTDQIAIINEYISTINNILNNLNTSYGYIKNEVASISKMKENFYINAETLNAKYINVLNIIETRIIQLESLQVTLTRMNTQILSYINIFNPNILPFNPNLNQTDQYSNHTYENNNNNNIQESNEELVDELNIENIKSIENQNLNEELIDDKTNNNNLIQNGEDNEINIETNITNEKQEISNNDIKEENNKEANNDLNVEKNQNLIEDNNTNTNTNTSENNITISEQEILDNIINNNQSLEQTNENAKELHDQVEEILNEIINSDI